VGYFPLKTMRLIRAIRCWLPVQTLHSAHCNRRSFLSLLMKLIGVFSLERCQILDSRTARMCNPRWRNAPLGLWHTSKYLLTSSECASFVALLGYCGCQKLAEMRISQSPYNYLERKSACSLGLKWIISVQHWYTLSSLRRQV
jgi:hypothetical protein